jgi:hypothetical protein
VRCSWPKCREVSSVVLGLEGRLHGNPRNHRVDAAADSTGSNLQICRIVHQLPLCSSRALNGVQPSGRASYWPIVRTTLERGRPLFADSLSCCVTISSYFGMVVTGERGTTCTTLYPPALS